MKKKFLTLLLALIILPCAFVFGGCKDKIDMYQSTLPEDQHYTLNLTHGVRDTGYDWESVFNVSRMTATVAGQNRDAVYIVYNYNDRYDSSKNQNLILLQVGNKHFYLDGDEWKKEDSEDYWSQVYNHGVVDYMTGQIRGRQFPQNTKTAENKQYIEYSFKNDEETFRISNDKYNILLYYTVDHNAFHVRHNAEIEFAEPTTEVPYLGTITAEMLQ